MNPTSSSNRSDLRHWAVVQVNAGTDPDRNRARAIELIEEASEHGVSLVALPEFFLIRGGHETLRDEALTLKTESVTQLARAASKNNVNLLAGSMPFENPEVPDRIFNRSILIDDAGEIVAQYDKIHLFDVDLSDGPTVRESEILSSGRGTVTAEIDGFLTGLSICYDLRFPELYRKFAEERVEATFVPSNFTRETGRAHWIPLLRARAIENQCYVIAPNQTGENPVTGVTSLGQSCIVDPWGQVIARCSDTEGWASARLDKRYLCRVRRELPSLAHRSFETRKM